MLTVTADNLPRLVTCNGSRLMGGYTPPVETDDTVRKEGNAAHWLVQQVYNRTFNVEELIDRKAPNGVYITEEMVEHLQPYLDSLMYSGLGGEIEIETSHAGENWQINGRADFIKYNSSEHHLIVRDLKYGWSIVEPEMNWTLISHALGWWKKTIDMPLIKVTFEIYQPRPYHSAGRIRSWTIDAKLLYDLGCNLALVLSNPTDILQTSEHCRNCPALAVCPAARNAGMNAIEYGQKAFVDILENNQLSFELDNVNRAIKMLEQLKKAYSELATHKLKQGEIVPNYAIESELANTSWLPYVTPEIAQIMTGKDLSKKEMITPAAAKRAGVSEDVVKSMTERRQKGFKIVRVDANTKATKIFGDKK